MTVPNQPIFLNLLVFDHDFQAGASQRTLIEHAVALGFDHIEIRREYFRDLDVELPQIKELAERFNLTLFYSVPDQIYQDGQLNPKLQMYLDEALFLGVTQIKWTIGAFDGELLKEGLEALLKTGIAITVENDQTQESGTITAIEAFMKQVNASQLAIGYVFDLGNFRFVQENEQDALSLLEPYVTYLHLKDVAYQGTQPVATDLGNGVIDWQHVLAKLSNVPVAIEYPTHSTTAILEAKEKIQEVRSHG